MKVYINLNSNDYCDQNNNVFRILIENNKLLSGKQIGNLKVGKIFVNQ